MHTIKRQSKKFCKWIFVVKLSVFTQSFSEVLKTILNIPNPVIDYKNHDAALRDNTSFRNPENIAEDGSITSIPNGTEPDVNEFQTVKRHSHNGISSS